jgi:hypothetical protein
MYKNISIKILGLLILSSALLASTGCSPKMKIGLWAKNNKDAAQALEAWVTDRPDEGALLLALDCLNRNQFKKKITDALNAAPAEQSAQPGYGERQRGFPYGNIRSKNSEDGFADWCRKYPKAAKRLRGHAKALCKTGLGILNGSIK